MLYAVIPPSEVSLVWSHPCGLMPRDAASRYITRRGDTSSKTRERRPALSATLPQV
jgi:hypothetical protein